METSTQAAAYLTAQTSGVLQRQRWTIADKRRIVEETLVDGTSVARVARAHGVNDNQVFYWRKLYQKGRLGGSQAAKLVPVTLTSESLPPASSTGEQSFSSPILPGKIHIELRHAQVRIEGNPDPAMVRVVSVPMITLPANTRIWIAAGVTDLRRGFMGLSALVQTKLEQSPMSGHVFVFRGRRGDLIKLLWFDGDGLCLLAKRLDRGRFVWPQASSGTVTLTPAQLSMLLEGIDWRRPERTWDPHTTV